MPIPDFIVTLRRMIGQHQLWMPGVTAVVVRDAEVLLVRRSDNGQWAPITGIPDPGEEPAAAARREALEETRVRVSVDRLAGVGSTPEVLHANGDRAVYLDLTFACSYIDGEAAVGDDESLEVRWWHRDRLPPMPDRLRSRIDAALSGETAARFVR